MSPVQLSVNGQSHSLNVDPDTPLLWVLRDHLDLTGTKFGCGVAECGACTVLLDGQAVRSCVTALAEAEGKEVTTIEGLARLGSGRDALHPLQQIWKDQEVIQCGYCQPGQLLTAAALLMANPRPTSEQVTREMAGVLCRCGTYGRIHKAVMAAAEGEGHDRDR